MKQLSQSSSRIIFALEIVAFSIVILIWISGIVFSIPFPELSANPISFLNAPFYQGILNRLGLLFWGFLLILNLFTYNLLGIDDKMKETKIFLLYSSLLFGFFLMDEMLLVHNYIFPKVLKIHQLLVLILYAVTALLFVIKFRKIIKNNYLLLYLAAISFLAMSMLVDILSYLKIIHFSFRYFLDDSIKFIGIFNLFIYYFMFCRKKLFELFNENTI